MTDKINTSLEPIQPTVEMMIMHAIDKYGAEGGESAVAIVERLVALKRDQEKWDAEKEFYFQLSEFQKACPQIKKTKSTGKVTDEGGKFGFSYAPLDEVERTIRPVLQPRGFSYYWDGKTDFVDGKFIREETCHLLHQNGHRIKSTISAPISEKIGSMNEVQRFGTVGSYLKRYSLLAVLGLPTTDEDTDGVDRANLEKISPEQLKALEDLISKAIPPSALPRFLKLFKVKNLADIPKSDYEFGLKKLAEFKTKYAEAK